MIRSMFRGAGRIALWAASMAFLTAISLLLVGSWMLTYPVLRTSPRNEKVTAIMNVLSSLLALVQAFNDQTVEMLRRAQAGPDADTMEVSGEDDA